MSNLCGPLRNFLPLSHRKSTISERKPVYQTAGLIFFMPIPNASLQRFIMLCLSEFSFAPIHSRRPVVAVPGVEYHLRKEANVALRRSGVQMASKWYFYLYQVLNRLGMPVYGTPWGLHLYNQFFQRTLKTSRYVYTARGGFGLPVRKFFEIPAAGALMLCSPCTGYEELGYVDGVHYHSVEPDELPGFLQELIRTGDGHDVAVAGRKVTAKNHSLYARAQQIALCLDALTKGSYRGARAGVTVSFQ